MMWSMSNRLRVWVALFTLLLSATLSGLSAGENGLDAAVEVKPGTWLTFALPEELRGSEGLHNTFYDADNNPILTVTPLREHPAHFVSRMASLCKSCVVESDHGSRKPYREYLTDSVKEVNAWSRAASLQPPYKLPGGVDPNPLSQKTRSTLETLQERWKKSSQGDRAVDVKELMKGSSTKLQKLQGTLADQYLLRLVLAQKNGHKYPFGKLASRKEKIGHYDVLIVTNELPQFTEEIVFIDFDTDGGAFSFRRPAGHDIDLSASMTTVFNTVRLTSRTPEFVSVRGRMVEVPAGLVALKQSIVFFVALILVVAAHNRAGDAWEICRSRESLSSRETYRTFKKAFLSLVFLGCFILYWNAIVLAEQDLLAIRNLSPSDAVPAFCAVLLASLLTTLGARLGCRFSKKGCQRFSAAGFLLGLVLITATVIGLLGN